MKREDLKNLGLTDEQIEKVMAEHGKDITSLQEKVNGLTNERDGLKSQLDERDQQLVDLQKNSKIKIKGPSVKGPILSRNSQNPRRKSGDFGVALKMREETMPGARAGRHFNT